MKSSGVLSSSELLEAMLDSLSEVKIEKEKDEGTQAAWLELTNSMDTGHVKILCEEFEAARVARESGKKYNINALARVAGLMIVLHLRPSNDQEDRPPLALPPKVADVYLSRPGYFPTHECAVCRYRYPISLAQCPLCVPDV